MSMHPGAEAGRQQLLSKVQEMQQITARMVVQGQAGPSRPRAKLAKAAKIKQPAPEPTQVFGLANLFFNEVRDAFDKVYRYLIPPSDTPAAHTRSKSGERLHKQTASSSLSSSRSRTGFATQIPLSGGFFSSLAAPVRKGHSNTQ